MRQHVQGTQHLSRKRHTDPAAILDGTLVQIVALDMLLGERDYVTNSWGGVPKQEDHGARSEPLVTTTADKVARRKHAHDLFLSEGLYIVGFE